MGREDYVDKSYSDAFTRRHWALYLPSVKTLETLSPECLPDLCCLNVYAGTESKLLFKLRDFQFEDTHVNNIIFVLYKCM